MKKLLAILICSALFCASITGCGTVGFAGARQQTVSINIRLEGDITPDMLGGGNGDAKTTGKGASALISITTGEMAYDGTRGDLGGTKATTGNGDANAASSRTIDLPNSGGAGAVDMAGGDGKDDAPAAEPEIINADAPGVNPVDAATPVVK